MLLVGGFVVTAMVARYLGPKSVGIMNYGVIISGLASIISQWGASHSIFNLSTKKPNCALRLINITTITRACIYSCVCLFGGLFSYYSFGSTDVAVMITAFSFSLIFTSLDLYQFHFNGVLKSKYNAIPFVIAKSFSMAYRVYLIYIDANLIYFAFAFTVEGFIIFFLKRKISRYNKFSDKVSDYYGIAYFYNSGTYLMFSGVLVYIYSRVNQIFLSNIFSFSELGIYSAALALSMAWTFIPNSIGISILTRAFSSKNEEEKMNGLAFTIFAPIICSLPILFIYGFWSKEIVSVVYGDEYSQVGNILLVLSIYSLISVLVFLSNRFISNENGERFLFIKTLLSTIFGVVICFILIKYNGLIGAVYGALFVELFGLICNLFFRKISIVDVYCRAFNIKLMVYYFKGLR